MTGTPNGHTFAGVLAAFTDMAALAKALGVPHSTVAAWKRRDSIPESRWRSIAAAAKDLRVKGVTYATLSEAARAKAPPTTRRSPP